MSEQLAEVPGFKAGDQVWPKPDSVMCLQCAPQVVLAVISDTYFGDWLWLMDAEAGPRSHSAKWWTTEPPSEEMLIAVERKRREVAERQRRFAVGEFGPPIAPLPVDDGGKTVASESTGDDNSGLGRL
jgi:hypothetical protein